MRYCIFFDCFMKLKKVTFPIQRLKLKCLVDKPKGSILMTDTLASFSVELTLTGPPKSHAFSLYQVMPRITATTKMFSLAVRHFDF